MTTRNDGGPAFPCDAVFKPEGAEPVYGGSGGMTLRDYFAASALIGIRSCSSVMEALMECTNGEPSIVKQAIAVEAYAIADEMLQERDKT